MNKNIIISIILIVVAGAGGFYVGMQYKSNSQQSSLQRGGQFRQRFGQNGGAVRGQIVSLDPNSATVKLMDGSTKIVILSGNTVFLKSAAATKEDVKAGDTVMAFGTQNSDGSLTAQNVQINPPERQRITPSQGAN